MRYFSRSRIHGRLGVKTLKFLNTTPWLLIQTFFNRKILLGGMLFARTKQFAKSGGSFARFTGGLTFNHSIRGMTSIVAVWRQMGRKRLIRVNQSKKSFFTVFLKADKTNAASPWPAPWLNNSKRNLNVLSSIPGSQRLVRGPQTINYGLCTLLPLISAIVYFLSLI
jgi:hypothetical protein